MRYRLKCIKLSSLRGQGLSNSEIIKIQIPAYICEELDLITTFALVVHIMLVSLGSASLIKGITGRETVRGAPRKVRPRNQLLSFMARYMSGT